MAHQHPGHAVDLLETDGEQAGPIFDPLLGSQPIEGVRARVDQPVGAARHAHAAAGTALGTEGQTGPADRDPMRPHQRPLRLVPVEDPGRAIGGRWQRAGPLGQREEFGQVVGVTRQGHLFHGRAVVRLHLAKRHGPHVERGLGEGHDLGAPYVREPAIGPRYDRGVRGARGDDPVELPDVPEGEVRAVGPLSLAGHLRRNTPAVSRSWRRRPVTKRLRRSPPVDRERNRDPSSRVAPRSITVICWAGVGRQGQRGTRRGRPGTNDQGRGHVRSYSHSGRMSVDRSGGLPILFKN